MGGHAVSGQDRGQRDGRSGVGFFRPPVRRLTVTVIVGAVVIGAVVWYFGLAIPQAALVAVAFAGVGTTWIAVQEGDRIDWPQRVHRRTPGARRDIETLSWSMKTRGGVAGQSLARVREATRRRLMFVYGLDLYAPGDRAAVETHLAPGVVRILLSPKQGNLDLATFTRCLSALERLGTDASPDTSSDTSPRTERHP